MDERDENVDGSENGGEVVLAVWEQAEVDQLEAAKRDGADRAAWIAARMADANARFRQMLDETNRAD
jgi:hypothetical protein